MYVAECHLIWLSFFFSTTDLIYQCSAPDEESEDLTCDCHYFEGSAYYNCTCYANPQEEREEQYLSCKDAFAKGQTEDGIYTIKPDHLDPFQVHLIHYWFAHIPKQTSNISSNVFFVTNSLIL